MPAERPRVLHVGPDAPGGMSASMRALLTSPLAQRYRLEFIATHRGLGAIERLAVYLTALLRLTWWSIRGRGRIVHLHSTKRASMFRKGVCVLLAKAMRRRVVLHVHAGPGDIDAFRAKIGGASVAFLRLSYRAADVVLAVSAASAAALERAFDARGIVVLPNPAPAGPSELPRRDEGVDPLAAYLGGFENPVKGGDVLLEALARPEAAGLRVALAGPGELPEPGRRLVEDRPTLEWRSWLGEAERDELLREASIFVLSSTSEGLPMALLEAMAYGLAIVATAVGGVPDVVEDEREALVVAPGDAVALADALVRLAGDPDLRERLGDGARERAAGFSAEKVADRIDAMYRSLL
jgi:glycosyltransferase involved in cell wall biosynthesis